MCIRDSTNIETTQIYARITNNKIGNDMQGLDKKFVGIEKIADNKVCGDTVLIERQKEQTYWIIPDEGKELDKLYYNGEDVTSQMAGSTFTAPALIGDATLKAVFEDAEASTGESYIILCAYAGIYNITACFCSCVFVATLALSLIHIFAVLNLIDKLPVVIVSNDIKRV